MGYHVLHGRQVAPRLRLLACFKRPSRMLATNCNSVLVRISVGIEKGAWSGRADREAAYSGLIRVAGGQRSFNSSFLNNLNSVSANTLRRLLVNSLLLTGQADGDLP